MTCRSVLRPAMVCMYWCVAALCLSQAGFSQWKADPSQSATSLGQSSLIQPAELAKSLEAAKDKPLVLNVGPRMLYVQAHIPGAEYIGPGSDAEGLKQLHARVNSLPHSKLIVLYCGCCPWSHCPNVAPAFTELQKMGFTNVKVLYIAENLGTDWVYKGYPTDRGSK